MPGFCEDKEKLNPRTQSSDWIDKKKLKDKTIKNMSVQREDNNNLGPVVYALQCQTIAHKIILEMGDALEKEYFDGKKKALRQLSNQKQDMLKMQMDDQFQKKIAIILSEVKSEYAKKLLEFTDNTVEKYNEAIQAKKTEIIIKCKEKIKQNVIDRKKMMLMNIENVLNEREKNLKLAFEHFKKQNLVDFTEYYQRLIASYSQRYENHIAHIKKEHNEKYEKMKTLLKNKHKKSLNLAKIKFKKNKLLSKKLNINSKPSGFVDDEKKQRKMESIKKQKAEKLEKLNRTNLQLEFYKKKINNVLNNYANIVSSTRKLDSNNNFLLDKNKMLHKYLSRPTENESQQLIQDKILSETVIN